MSFKREGDDGSQLNVLKKRRVAELLASYIPEDEALLLKNGTYACTVCHHRPVFDTVDMLSVHRKGKKHTACLQKFYGKKAAHKNEVLKRQHEQYVRAEEAGEQPPAPLLELTRKITQHALLKAAPYNSCCTRHRPEEVRRKGSSSEVEGSAQSMSSLLRNRPVCTQPDQPKTPAETSGPEPSSSTGSCRQSQSKKDGKKKKMQKSLGKGEDPADDPERTRVMEHYLSLRSSGWIPDGAGKWVKDENVEFDSDEDEPPAIPPP
ncbi:sodium channel modifier 1 isoform X2 [Phyllobates terribilis]|uniref:sodium channel modifier 1 isoform X2 n=1 Tax=Phyllobates terribilis TaxID=111132 RepID=UPI003CCB6358